MTKADLYQMLEEKQQLFFDTADAIWADPELSLSEHHAAARYTALLEELGFTVENRLAGMETAFSGRFGSGRPVIGILGEYDALAGLSQQAGALEPCPATKDGDNDCGHGCGHHLLGVGSLAAAWAVKEYLAASGESGTVIYYGCPGEEGGAGKAFMARDGLFYGLDAALTWHPGSTNEVFTGTNNTSMQVEYTFHGIAAHAAGNPHQGRSALDAVELMNLGVQFLREHIPTTDCLHYAVTNAGGISPNVVQSKATVLYMVRSDTVPHNKELLARVDRIAEGAALMTDTSFTRRFIDGTADLLPNEALERALYKNMAEIPLPEYTQSEREFAAALDSTCPRDEELPGMGAKYDWEIRKRVAELSDNGAAPLNDFLLPYFHSDKQSPGSTDVGDVSWQTPTAQITAVTWPAHSPGHSWQNVSGGTSGVAHKGMLYAAKVLAGAAVDLFTQPELLEKARTEFQAAAARGYTCPIEPDATPVPVEEMLYSKRT
ncbi:amidohydrolase [Acutalibacter sp. 1XD8-33]|uniref:amidohydrolase n=1 Tax=Acutalibacter sp. 1XD8-33 TaxID=2320081 RepID=UPI000EA28699|nr:amidohydrolase [Acutalibacter sp. 1XD8-33]RKJ40803.1 amidohydrolase [Acutalibacter sp. 1XD8-33]